MEFGKLGNLDAFAETLRKQFIFYIVGSLQAYDNRETMDYSNGAISWSATPLTPQARAKDSNFQQVSSGKFIITVVAAIQHFLNLDNS